MRGPIQQMPHAPRHTRCEAGVSCDQATNANAWTLIREARLSGRSRVLDTALPSRMSPTPPSLCTPSFPAVPHLPLAAAPPVTNSSPGGLTSGSRGTGGGSASSSDPEPPAPEPEPASVPVPVLLPTSVADPPDTGPVPGVSVPAPAPDPDGPGPVADCIVPRCSDPDGAPGSSWRLDTVQPVRRAVQTSVWRVG